MKSPCVYILASYPRGTFYVGATTDIATRMKAHKEDLLPGFSKRYSVTRLVYLEAFETIAEMARRERSIKRWRREYKFNLIERDNPNWDDLYRA